MGTARLVGKDGTVRLERRRAGVEHASELLQAGRLGGGRLERGRIHFARKRAAEHRHVDVGGNRLQKREPVPRLQHGVLGDNIM